MKKLLQSSGYRRIVQVIFCLLLFPILSSACKKGDTGPAGTTGSKGDPGVPNVMYSDWFTPTSFVKTVSFGLNRLSFDKAATQITQPVIDSGAVLVFGKLNGYVPSIWPTDQTAQFPIIITYLSGTTIENDTWSALRSVGNLRISFVNDNNLYGSVATTHQFRYIVVPGGVKINAAGFHLKKGSTQTNGAGVATSQESSWNALTYEEICSALNIPE